MKSQKGEPVNVASASMPASVPLPGPASASWTQNQESLSRLFTEHHRRVLLAAYRITGSLADAEDVTQAVFLRLTADSSLAANNERSYLYRAAINGALDLLRKRKRAGSEPIEQADQVKAVGEGSSPDLEASGRQTIELLRTAIAELTPRAAEIFTLRYLEEMGNREIAQITGTSAALVAVTLYQTRSRLKNRLKELERTRP
jgi:RNA polymerase sigma factor (sigma-70 family)